MNTKPLFVFILRLFLTEHMRGIKKKTNYATHANNAKL